MEKHKIRRNKTITYGHEYELKNDKLIEVHDWFVKIQKHRFECECGKEFNKEETAIEHLKQV